MKWHKDCHELYASTQAKKEIYDVQVDADLKLASQKQLLKHLDEFQTIREQFVLRQQADTELKNLNQQLLKFEPNLQQAELAQQQAMSQQQQAEKELQAWQQHVEQLKPQLEIAAQLQHEISSKLQQYTALDAAQKLFLAQQIQPVQNDLNQLTTQLATEQQQQQHLQQQFKQTAAWANFDENLALTLQRLQDYLQLEQQLRQQNPAGNTTTSQYSNAVTVDVTAPNAAVITLAADTGSSSTDGITNNGTINVTLRRIGKIRIRN